jgi:hypothetical protein
LRAVQWSKKEYLTLSFICFCVISREFFSSRSKKGLFKKKAFLKMKKKVSQKKREQQVSKQTKWAKKIFFNKTLKFILNQ